MKITPWGYYWHAVILPQCNTGSARNIPDWSCLLTVRRVNSTVFLVLSYSSDESICSSIQGWGKVTQWWEARNNTQFPSLSRQWGTLVFPGSQHCSLCCCSLPIHTSFFFSPSLLKESHQVFLSLWEHKNLYIYTQIHLYKRQQLELLV